MKLHRYYVGDMHLEHEFWMQDLDLFHQWTKVLRYQPGREVVLFNDSREERLYKIVKIGNDAVQLELVTEMKAKVPEKELYLCFSLLKKDKNEWVLQKGTELGVRHFVPLVCDRTEKTGFDMERAQKIVVEATEQCGRSDIPSIREPITVQTAVDELRSKVDGLYIAEQGDDSISIQDKSLAVFTGPEGGWSDEEKQFFTEKVIHHVSLSSFTLRAETAAVIAASLVQ